MNGNTSPSESSQPLVSCIIIFLDEEKYLGEAIESVLAQTYPNWELLLIDDGSSDASESIAREYADGAPGRIRCLTHDDGANRGMSASRNLGLEQARGPLAAFCDGDDAWFPDKLERQVALFAQNPDAVLVCGATLYWYSWEVDDVRPDRTVLTGELMSGEGDRVCVVAQDRLYYPAELMKLLYPLGRGVTPSISGVMFTRDMAAAVGGFEDSFPGLFEDQVFRAKAYLAGPVFVSSACFDRYRQHNESCSQATRVSGRSKDARRRFLRWLKTYLDRVDCRDPVIRAKLRRRIVRGERPQLYRLLRRLKLI